MSEYDLIRSFAGAFPRSPLQQNGLFASDAEIIKIGDHLWGLTIDEFSPEEDLFTSQDPFTLGANLATATLSDLFAVGAVPEWFMHSLTLPREADQALIDGLRAGIADVLGRAGCSLCGGDMGSAESWRFCGFAMGPVGRSLSRIMPGEPQSLWATGTLGDANLAALTGAPTPAFELRLKEAAVIRERATGCIDTSGGFFDSVWLLHELNPDYKFEIDLDLLPIAAGIREAAGAVGFPAEAALLGGAGEYELLFTLPESVSELDIEATKVGNACPDQCPGVSLYREHELVSQMTSPPPCPRDAASVQDHIGDVIKMASTLFSGPNS